MSCLNLLEASSKPWSVVSLNRLCSVTGSGAARLGRTIPALPQGARARRCRGPRLPQSPWLQLLLPGRSFIPLAVAAEIRRAGGWRPPTQSWKLPAECALDACSSPLFSALTHSLRVQSSVPSAVLWPLSVARLQPCNLLITPLTSSRLMPFVIESCTLARGTCHISPMRSVRPAPLQLPLPK